MFIKQSDYALIKLHKKYNIFLLLVENTNNNSLNFFLLSKRSNFLRIDWLYRIFNAYIQFLTSHNWKIVFRCGRFFFIVFDQIIRIQFSWIKISSMLSFLNFLKLLINNKREFEILNISFNERVIAQSKMHNEIFLN